MNTQASQQQWSHLYDLADQLYTLAPWGWMAEDELIALKQPETGEMGYISIMGALGNYPCLTIYMGEEALHRFNLMHNPPEGDDSDLTQIDGTNILLETRQLQASFETRDMLEKVELAQIKQLGRRYRGGNWPQFQSYHPGQCPGPLDASELEWLTLALEQTLACAASFKDGAYHDAIIDAAQWILPCREQIKGEWQQTQIPYDNTLYILPSPEPSELLAAKVARHQSGPTLQCRCFLLPQPIGKKYGERQFPYLLMVVDSESELILGFNLLSLDDQELDTFKATLPDAFLKIFDQHSICPAEIQVGDHSTGMLLHKTSVALKCPLTFHSRLGALDEAMNSMPF